MTCERDEVESANRFTSAFVGYAVVHGPLATGLRGVGRSFECASGYVCRLCYAIDNLLS